MQFNLFAVSFAIQGLDKVHAISLVSVLDHTFSPSLSVRVNNDNRNVFGCVLLDYIQLIVVGCFGWQ